VGLGLFFSYDQKVCAMVRAIEQVFPDIFVILSQCLLDEWYLIAHLNSCVQETNVLVDNWYTWSLIQSSSTGIARVLLIQLSGTWMIQSDQLAQSLSSSNVVVQIYILTSGQLLFHGG
tara:strand:- start:47 stop:400 length:354 start_codon:yes stop_codon:yes gene_type:complete